jgi:hypothetical protein
VTANTATKGTPLFFTRQSSTTFGYSSVRHRLLASKADASVLRLWAEIVNEKITREADEDVF